MASDPTVSVGAPPDADVDAPAEDTVSREGPLRYERREELGRGGMGRVVAAFDRHLGREVAVKELLDDRSAQAAARFVREARVMAALEHPGIVPVHELGRRADGSLYYTMRRVRGRSFAEALAAGPDERERRRLVDTFVGVCQAVAYAHGHGVVHRDLKPANLMIGERGEALVLDWGLAQAHGTAAEPGAAHASPPWRAPDGVLTAAGALLGTPAYMSPEQARGERVDARGDCWALGLVLYEIVEGRRAWSGPSDTLLTRLRAGEAPPPLDRAPPELAAVIRRALEPDPAARYPDAGALLDDLQAWRDHTRVSAYTYTLWSEVRRLGRRYARELVLLGSALVVVGLVAGVAARRVVVERDRAALAETDLSVALARALEDRAWAHLLDEDAAGSLIVAAEGLRLRDTPRLHGLAAAALGRDAPTLRWEATVPPESLALAWSPDGDWLLVVGHEVAQVWKDGRLVVDRKVTDGLLDGARFVESGGAGATPTAAPGAVAWFPLDGGTLERIDLDTGVSRIYTLPDAPIQGDSSARRIVAIHEDGESVYLGREDDTVQRMSLASDRPDGAVETLPWLTPTRRRGWIGAGPGRAWLAEVSDGPTLRSLPDGALLARVPLRPVMHLARVGPWMVTSGRRTSGNARLGVFDDAGVVTTEATGLAAGNDALAPVPAQSALWVAGGGPFLRAFAVPALTPGLGVRHGGRRAVGAAWRHDRLAVVSAEGRLTVWDAPEALAVVPPTVAAVTGLTVRAGLPWTVGADGELVSWSPAPRRAAPLPDPARIFTLPDGTLLSSDRTDLLWLDADGAVTGRIAGLGEVFAFALDPDTGLLAVGGGHQEVGLVDLATRTPRWISGHLGTDIADLRWVGADLRTIHVDGMSHTLSGHDGAVRTQGPVGEGYLEDAATSPDGRWIAIARSLPPRLELYTSSGASVSLLASAPLTDGATDLRWGPDGRVYTATFDGTVHVHGAPDLALHAVVPLERGQLRALALTDDTLYAAGAAGRLHRVPLRWLGMSAAALAAEAKARFGLGFVDGDVGVVGAGGG
ncbi:MAG: serine/threonine-protein kinase [Myxococcota bacterium]